MLFIPYFLANATNTYSLSLLKTNLLKGCLTWHFNFYVIVPEKRAMCAPYLIQSALECVGSYILLLVSSRQATITATQPAD